MIAEGGREGGRGFTTPGEESKERRQMREVTLTPTRARAGTLQSPALTPPLPAKEHTSSGMAREAHLEKMASAGTAGEKRMRRYTKTIQVEEPNTGQVHSVIPDGR